MLRTSGLNWDGIAHLGSRCILVFWTYQVVIHSGIRMENCSLCLFFNKDNRDFEIIFEKRFQDSRVCQLPYCCWDRILWSRLLLEERVHFFQFQGDEFHCAGEAWQQAGMAAGRHGSQLDGEANHIPTAGMKQQTGSRARISTLEACPSDTFPL